MAEKKSLHRQSERAAVLRNQRLTGRLKKLFPLLISLILLFIVLWPQVKVFWLNRLSALQEKTAVTTMTHEGELLEPHYFATNKAGETFELKAKSAHAINTEAADLENPSCELHLKSGKTLHMEAKRAVYRKDHQELLLTDGGTVSDTSGNIFRFSTSTFLLQASVIYSADPVRGMGPLGTLEAKGFDIFDNGARCVLRGRVKAGALHSPQGLEPAIVLQTHGGEILTAQGSMTYERASQTIHTQHGVELTSPKGLIRADQMVAYLKPQGGQLALDHVDALGHVHVETPEGTITGERGVYFADRQAALIKGNVEVKRQNHYARGTEVEADFKTGESRLKSPGQQQGKQVRIIIDGEQIHPIKGKE